MKQLMKGRIGVARRVHWLEALSEYSQWASSHCKKWAGFVNVVHDRDQVTCRDCARLDAASLSTEILEGP